MLPEPKISHSINKNIRILVVDDYNTMRRLIKSLLRQLGFEKVDEAEDGAHALSLLGENKYDLIISDWKMEPMTGYELLQQVRATAATKEIPFIMVTGESSAELIVAAQDAGVSNYIVKPFNAQALKKKMEHVFGVKL